MTYQELEAKYPSKEFGYIDIERRYNHYGATDLGWELCPNRSYFTPTQALQLQKDLAEAIDYCRGNE